MAGTNRSPRVNDKFRKRAGAMLRSARSKAGLTAQQMIEKAADQTLTKSLVSQYENGAVLPSLSRLRSLMAACGSLVPGPIVAAYRAVGITTGMSQVIGSDLLKEFIAAWAHFETIAEIAEELGVTRASIFQTARNLRRRGINLPSKGRPDRYDWDAIKAFAAESGFEVSDETD